MHPVEIQNAIDGAVFLIDTREQDTARLRDRIKQIGLPVERKTLHYGDYSIKCPLPNGEWLDLSETVTVERKMGADEICQCFTHDRGRFEREFERAKAANAKIYLLVENGEIEKAYKGEYRSKMKSKALVASVFAWLSRYDCIYLSCPADLSGLVIKDILFREMKERLLND